MGAVLNYVLAIGTGLLKCKLLDIDSELDTRAAATWRQQFIWQARKGSGFRV